MNYEDLNLKVPVEDADYEECSKFITDAIESIMKEAVDSGRNKIVINTNLKLGIPMENVNKIAGPFVEAWANEIFTETLELPNKKYDLLNVVAGERLNMADVILQFKRAGKQRNRLTGHVDVKATSNDIANSGKSPNITSFARIRSAYLQDPNFIFIILSIKHKVFSERDEATKMMMGVMEVVDFNAYDLKYIATNDISYNPALGTGQLQVRDIHYVNFEKRSTWEFCQLLDKKFIASKKGFTQWREYAIQNEWIR